jgi:hypothetical protein
MFEWSIAPELVWGLIPRLVGVLYIIAFGSLAPQLRTLIGSRGLGPVKPRLEMARRDYPGLRRFLDFPTLLWINSSDRSLTIMPWLGVACGAVCVYGGPLAPWAHALGWLLWLSLEPAMLIFPWDTMLQEVGFLSLFLPGVEALPKLTAESLPYPAVAFMFRFLVLRLMLGFGKVKFIGTKREDSLYLRGFFVWGTSPTPLSWFAHHLPAWLLRSMLGFMFVAEVIAPMLGFFAGPLRLISFALLAALMIGIHLTGNWGYFNIGYVLLCVCLLDVQSTLFDLGREPWASTLWHWPQIAVNALMACMFLTGLLYLVAFDSWTTRTLIRWPLDVFSWNRRWLRVLLAYLRAISPLRIINGYGVFPPGALAPMSLMPIFEGSDDGVVWKAYRYRHIPSSPKEPPRFVAPYHARLDIATGYSTSGVFDGSFYGSLVGDGTPYTCYTRSSWHERLCQRLLEGEPGILRLLGHNPFPDAPPKFMRVAVDALTPAHPEVRRATGDWWHVRRCGVFIAAHGKQAWPDAIALPEAEVFHPDWVDYKRRAAPLRAIVRAYLSGVDPDRAILTDSDLTMEDVRAFWEDFLPAANEGRGDFSRHAQKAAELETRFGKIQLARFERVLERFAWLLRVRTERHQFADAEPKLPIASNFRYHMFLQELVMDGRAACHAYLSDVALVVKRLETSSDERQLWALTLLRHRLMVMHMAVFRWTPMGADNYKRKIPGLFEYYPLLSKFPPPDEEFRPEIVKHASGEHSIAGFYPPPKLSRSDVAEPAAQTPA